VRGNYNERMVRDGLFYGLGMFLLAVIVWKITGLAGLSAVPIVLGLFFLWFFRDPPRRIPLEPGLIVSPADGKVDVAEWIETEGGSRLRVTIFLNVFNVHVNRVPVSGTVELVEFRQGQFLNAMRPDSAVYNEQTLVVVNTGEYKVSFKQVAGLLARRIICTLKEGDNVQRGQRMGMIKFGSRMDILMPAEARLCVKTGQHVTGGKTALAQMPVSAAQPGNPTA
jgi:phosphatidylserine decarboxylase